MSSLSPECPLCGSEKARPAAAGLFLCRKCGCLYSRAWHRIDYGTDYFTAGYLKQYGHTYEDDFPSIYGASVRRLRRIRRISGLPGNSGSSSVLDIGCALGFFLKAAEDAGFKKISGLEISEYAAGRCRDLYGYDVIRDNFEEISLPGKYSLISCWYFIEHCQEPAAAVKKIYDALEPGGVLAFSVPSIYGPMFRHRRKVWAETRPGDHRIDLSPASAGRFLKACGFKKIRCCGAGFHPERLVNPENIFFRPFSFLYRIFSGLTAYSDTLEVYAVK